MSSFLKRSGAIALLGLIACQPLHALERSYELQAGAGTTSNVARVPVNAQRETLDVLGLKLAAVQTRSRFELAALGALEYQHYQSGLYGDDLIGNLRARANATLLPERIRWLAEYSFGQTLVDSFAAPSPANRQNVSAFSTGPSFNQPFGTSNRLRADARYTAFRFQTSRLDSHRTEFRGAAIHDLSARAHLSLNANLQQATFTQQQSFAHFDQQEGYARFAASNSRSLLNLDLGYTRARSGQAWDGATLARLMALRRLSSAASVSLSVGRAYSDAGSSFMQMQSLSPGLSSATQATQGVPDQFLNEFATVGWGLSRNRTAIRIEAMHFREHYRRLTVNDRRRSMGSLSLAREFTDSLGIEAHGTYERQQFEVTHHAFDERTLGTSLNWRPGRALTLRASYDTIRRTGDAVLPGYRDTQVWFRVGYASGSLASMAAASTLRDASMMDAAAALDRGTGAWE